MKKRRPWDGDAVQPSSFSRETLYYAIGTSSLGGVLVALSHRGIVMINVADDPVQLRADLEATFPHAHFEKGHRDEKRAVAMVVDSIENPCRRLDLTLDMRGTPFQKRVWRAVQEIPLGQTRTYAGIAEKIGSPRAMRAVGTACAKCLLAIAVPCHRVLRSSRPLTGSDWSEGRQQALLARELAAVNSRG